jgi:hypothetical protein
LFVKTVVAEGRNLNVVKQGDLLCEAEWSAEVTIDILCKLYFTIIAQRKSNKQTRNSKIIHEVD